MRWNHPCSGIRGLGCVMARHEGRLPFRASIDRVLARMFALTTGEACPGGSVSFEGYRRNAMPCCCNSERTSAARFSAR